MDPATLVFTVQFASAGFMTGLIWFVQRVQYPLMSSVSEDTFTEYHRRHVARTTEVVAGVMLVEFLTAAGLVWVRPPWLSDAAVWTGLGLLVVVWVATAVGLVPPHKRLSAGFDAAAHRRLVGWNWVRTIAWTLRLLVLAHAGATGLG